MFTEESISFKLIIDIFVLRITITVHSRGSYRTERKILVKEKSKDTYGSKNY